MPLPPFEKLSPRKKERLLSAAVSEFSKHPYDRVSVFEIARSAEISRSSFYYYFADKEDLYDYLLDRLREQFLDSIPEEVDLFRFPALVLDFFASQRETERGPFIARLLEHAQIWVHDDFIRMSAPKRIETQRIKICCAEQLEALSPEDLRLLRFLFWECSCHGLNAYYRREVTREELDAGMNRVIELFRYGVNGRAKIGEGSR